MKDKLSQMASWAGKTVTSAANKTADFVQSHKPSEEDLEHAKALAVKAGKAVADQTVALGKEVMQSKTFKDAAKGAGVGALAAIPIPVIGPAVGAVIGASAGVYIGRNMPQPSRQQALPLAPEPQNLAYIDVVAEPPKDLYVELLKLDELRQKGLLTSDEFETQKQKLIQKY
jgi:Short C-terminal domain